MVITYTNLSGPRESGYDPTYDTGFVAVSPNNTNIYVREIPPQANLSAGAKDTEGAIQIISAGGAEKRTVKLLPFLNAAYEQESDYDVSETLQINGGTFVDQKLFFDNTGYMYAHVRTSIDGVIQHYMMTSKDDGNNWSAYRLPQTNFTGLGGAYNNNRFMAMEYNTGPNIPDNPPCFLSHTDVAANRNLYLVIPYKDLNPPVPSSYNSGPQSFNPPEVDKPIWEGSSRDDMESRMFSDEILITNNSIYTIVHSGGCSIASYGEYILVVYPTNEDTGGVGTNQWVAVVSRYTKQIIRKVFLGKSETANGPDNHDIPSIVIDSNGIAHVVISGHHTPNKYIYSRSSDYSVWSNLEEFGHDVVVGTDGGYTYTALLCDSQNRLHTVHRSAKVGYEFSLGYNRRNTDGTWEYPTSDLRVVDVNRSFYSVWYHRFMLGKNDKLYLTFSPLFSQLSADEITYYNELFPGELPFYWHPYQSTSWSNVSNAIASDSDYATCVLAANAISREIQATNFDFSAIGDEETIEGILFEVERKATAVSVIHYSSWALKGTGTTTIVSTPVGNQLFTGDWAVAEGTDSSGGASELHGYAWTVAEIKHEGFGFRISGKSLGLASTLSVNHMQVTVYTDGGTYGPISPGTMASSEPGIASGQRAHGSCTIYSDDGGDTWQLANIEDL